MCYQVLAVSQEEGNHLGAFIRLHIHYHLQHFLYYLFCMLWKVKGFLSLVILLWPVDLCLRNGWNKALRLTDLFFFVVVQRVCYCWSLEWEVGSCLTFVCSMWLAWVSLMELLIFDTHNEVSLWYGSGPSWLVRKAGCLLMDTESLRGMQTDWFNSAVVCLTCNELALDSECLYCLQVSYSTQVRVKMVNFSLSFILCISQNWNLLRELWLSTVDKRCFTSVYGSFLFHLSCSISLAWRIWSMWEHSVRLTMLE